MNAELCPYCRMPKRDEKPICTNQSMVFYECNTTEVLSTDVLELGAPKVKREVYKRKTACIEIERLRAKIDELSRGSND